MKSKKALILAVSVLTIIAITVGVTFAVWDTFAVKNTFEISTGKNVHVEVAVTRYNDANAASDQNYYNADGVVDETKGLRDLQKLIGKSGMDVSGSNQLRNMLIADFQISETSGWVVGTQIGLKYNVINKGFKDGSTIADNVLAAIEVSVYAAADVTGLNGGFRCMAQPAGTPIAVDTANTLAKDVKYYVFLQINDVGLALDDIKALFEKEIAIEIEITADAI